MKQTKQHTVSVVIPMYNEVDNAEPLLKEVQQALSDTSIYAYEIIVIDDASTDGTGQKLAQLQQHMPQLRVLRHRHNYGQSAGVVTGVRAAKYDWVATLDGDGQNDPADIPLLCVALDQQWANRGADDRASSTVMIVGNRKKRDDSWLRLLSSRIANGVRGRLLRDNCPDTGCGLKLFNRHHFLQLPHFNHVHRFLPALIRRAGGTVINVPVNHRARVHGQSKYGLMNRLWVGIVDLFGVMWLIRRPCNPEADECKS